MRFSDGEVLFLWPLSLHVITAGWLYSDGKTKTGNQSYGNLIRITHKAYAGERLQTYYAHLSSVSVKSGQATAGMQLLLIPLIQTQPGRYVLSAPIKI